MAWATGARPEGWGWWWWIVARLDVKATLDDSPSQRRWEIGRVKGGEARGRWSLKRLASPPPLSRFASSNPLTPNHIIITYNAVGVVRAFATPGLHPTFIGPDWKRIGNAAADFPIHERCDYKLHVIFQVTGPQPAPSAQRPSEGRK